MGGDYYDREVVQTTSRSGASAASAAALSQKQLHKDCNPQTRGKIKSSTAQPIIICCDVTTGSMGDWPRVIYDKMPMFYGQILMQKYLTDPSLCFMAIGGLPATLQVCDFATGSKIDEQMKKLMISGVGGRGAIEDFQFCPYYLNRFANFSDSRKKPIVFVIGDARFHPKLQPAEIKRVFGSPHANETIDTHAEWKKLMQRAHVFHLHKYYCTANLGSCETCRIPETASMKQWVDTLGAERVLNMAGKMGSKDSNTSKASVDAMLGVISMISGSRSLDGYCNDMAQRGQDKQRINFVRKVLTEVQSAIISDCKEYGGILPKQAVPAAASKTEATDAVADAQKAAAEAGKAVFGNAITVAGGGDDDEDCPT